MFLFRKKIPPVSEANRIFEARRQFRNLVETEILFTKDQSKENAIDLLSYLQDTVARDWCESAIANPLYQGLSSPIYFSFPHSYADETGKVQALSYDLREVFLHIKTDGAHWINAHSDEMLAPVPDFRLAGIYYIAKRRWLLRNS